MPDLRRTAPELTPAELDAEAAITAETEMEADVDAERFGSPLLRAMLDATPMLEHPATEV